MDHYNQDVFESAREVWGKNAEDLAEWALSNLVNRTDAYGSYLPLAKRTSSQKAKTKKVLLTKSILERHFCGLDVGHLIGLHTTSTDNTSRWLAIDIDNHSNESEVAKTNLRVAQAWRHRLQQLGFSALIIDTDGYGSLHILMIFNEPVPTADVFTFGQNLTSTWKEEGLDSEPELFPKQAKISSSGFGNFLRLPGHHHTNPYFSRILSENGEFLNSEDTVRALLACPINNYPQLSDSMLDQCKSSILKNVPILCKISPKATDFLQNGANNGERNNSAFRAAAELAGAGLTENEILKLVGQPAQRSGLEETEIATIVRSAISRPRTPIYSDVKIVNTAHAKPQSPFPIDCLPIVARKFVEAGAKAFDCGIATFALPVMTVFAAAIGNARRIILKMGWSEPSVIWLALVANSGTKKSPILEAAIQPMLDQERKFLMSSGEMHDLSGSTHERKIICDSTLEALCTRFAVSPRGLLLYRDELSGWFQSHNAYRGGRGGDLSHYLCMHGARDVIVDRKTSAQNQIFVRRAALSILGAVTTDGLRRILTRARLEDGVGARFLFVMQDESYSPWNEHTIPIVVYKKYEETVQSLMRLPVVHSEANYIEPVELTLSPEAKQLFIKFFNKHALLRQEIGNPALLAAWAKLEAYAARFALVIHVTNHINRGQDDSQVCIDAESMASAIKILEWCRGETQRVYSILQEDECDALSQLIVRYIIRRGGCITIRELMRANYPSLNNVVSVRTYLDKFVAQGIGLWQDEKTFRLLLGTNSTLDT